MFSCLWGFLVDGILESEKPQKTPVSSWDVIRPVGEILTPSLWLPSDPLPHFPFSRVRAGVFSSLWAPVTQRQKPEQCPQILSSGLSRRPEPALRRQDLSSLSEKQELPGCLWLTQHLFRGSAHLLWFRHNADFLFQSRPISWMLIVTAYGFHSLAW